MKAKGGSELKISTKGRYALRMMVDHFESAPFDAALIALAPLWQKADFHEIEDFLFKWEHMLRNEDDTSADVQSYIQELDDLVTLLMQR